MASDQFNHRCRQWYGRLLRLYPGAYHQRFAEGMEQTFCDVCRERQQAGGGRTALIAWLFVETFISIIRENRKVLMMDSRSLVARNKRLVGIMLGVTALLMVPAVAMLYTQEVQWGAEDFIAAAILLGGTGLLFELVLRRGGSLAYRAGAGLGLFAALALVWINLAVGLIGSEDNPANLMYFGVIGIGMTGAGIARFQPHGMARALFVTALAQALVPVIAMAIWRPPFSPGVVAVFALNAVFVLLFFGSALLFRHAGSSGQR
jgi:hypothetical protein